MTPDPSGAARAPQTLAELLAEVRGALQQATPGPWHRITDGGGICRRVGARHTIVAEAMLYATNEHDDGRANAHLIAHAPEWLGALVQAVEDQQGEIERLNRVLTARHGRAI